MLEQQKTKYYKKLKKQIIKLNIKIKRSFYFMMKLIQMSLFQES